MKLVYSCNGQEVIYYGSRLPIRGELSQNAFLETKDIRPRTEKRSEKPYKEVRDEISVSPREDIIQRKIRYREQRERFIRRTMKGIPRREYIETEKKLFIKLIDNKLEKEERDKITPNGHY